MRHFISLFLVLVLGLPSSLLKAETLELSYNAATDITDTWFLSKQCVTLSTGNYDTLFDGISPNYNFSSDKRMCLSTTDGHISKVEAEFTGKLSMKPTTSDSSSGTVALASDALSFTWTAKDGVNISDIAFTFTVTAYVKNIKVTLSDVPAEVGLRQDVNAAFSDKSALMYVGRTPVSPALSCTSDGTVLYSSSDDSVATVDESGIVTPLQAGKAVISARFAATANYNACMASYAVIVRNLPTSVNAVFKKIESVEEITASDTYVLADAEKGGVFGTYSSSAYKSEDVDLRGDFCYGDSQQELKLSSAGSGLYYIMRGTKYLKYSGSGTAFSAETSKSSATKWSITIVNGSATIAPVSTSTRAIACTDEQIGYKVYDSSICTSLPSLYVRCPDTSITIPEGFGTYYSAEPFVMPEGLEGGIITATSGNGTVNVEYRYQSGGVVPASTPLLIHGSEGIYPIVVTDCAEAAPVDNLLHGSDDVDAEGNTSVSGGDYYYYKLSYSQDGLTVGFYWATAGGGAFKTAEGKAYLALEKAMNIRRLPLNGNGETTAVKDITVRENNQTANHTYTLSGQRVDGTPRTHGIYIVGGKKTVK